MRRSSDDPNRAWAIDAEWCDSPLAEAGCAAGRAADRGRLLVNEEDRVQVFELFRWYRLGAGL